MPRDYRVFLDDILDAARKVLEYTAGFSDEEFFSDRKTVEAVVWNLQIIGEAAKRVPEEIRSRYPDLPWREMGGLRDIIVHQYLGIKLDVIWKVIQNDVPMVENRIRWILDQME
ncbi:MAG: DUF86 domain-containing protein [Desulfomonile tiedjei]|uniref:DUF86 domain-containing protein n=1 Tax=Desulfomonile tiedjei TaxID=2358 RepID=A0A9D6UYY0_9BACT|nr:DUF86 domain-containing protein [Desulfomonile tiedjei]